MRPMLLSLILLGVSLDDVSAQEEHRQALLEAREAWGQAIAEGNVEKIFSVWTHDVVIYPVSEPAVRGIDAVVEYVRRNRQELGIRPQATSIEIAASASGDLGYILGTHEWIDRERRATMPGRYVTLWRKDDQGVWRCFFEIHSPRTDANGARTETQPDSTGNKSSTPMRRESISGTFAPKGPPQESPLRVAAGESCIVDLKQNYNVTGGLSGSFEIDYRILVKGPCGSPIGTFEEEWIAHGDFKGEFNGKPVAGKLSYLAAVKAGGDVQGRLTFGQGLGGELRISGNFSDGKLSYQGWVRRAVGLPNESE